MRFNHITRASCVLPSLLVVAATSAHAQCVGPIVDPEQGYAFTPDGYAQTVEGVIEWDPDGDGPEPAWSVFNGTFRRAATVMGNGLAAFDGRAWRGEEFGLADSIFAVPSVRQAFVHEGDLYAVLGMYDEATGSYRVWRRWNGTRWIPGGPLAFNTTSSGSSLVKVVSFKGDIVAIGLAGYRTGDSEPPPRSLLARADPMQDVLWQAAGPPVSEFNGIVRAATVSGTSLYLGGMLNGVGVEGAIANIARWDGTQMHALGAGLNGDVTDIFVEGGDVYATGLFTQSGDAPLVGVAKWNGSAWSQVGDGLLSNTQSVVVHNGVVYVVARSGQFDNVYRLEDGQWVLDARTDLPVPPSTTAVPSLVSLEIANDALYMVGRFRGVNGQAIQAVAVRVEGREGAAWKSPSGGFNAPVASMALYNGRLLATGSFSRAGDESVAGIAEWNGQRWGPSDVPDSPGRIVSVDGDIYALAANPARVFKFDGWVWNQLGSAITAEDGAPVQPTHLASFDGDLYLAVSASFASPTASGVRLQRWSGTQWEGVGGVIMRASGTPSSLSVAVVQDQLYLSYYADTLDGQPFAGGLLRWDGQNLTPVAHNGGAPLELLARGDTLEAIRAFTQAGVTSYVSAVLNGSEWITTGRLPESPTSYFLSQFTAVGDERFALVSTTASPAQVVVARLDRDAQLWVPVSDVVSLPSGTLPEQPGASWSPRLVAVGSEVHLYGTFSRIGEQTAVNWARVMANGVPLIVEEPSDIVAECGGPVVLRVGVANGNEAQGALEYQWYFNGEALSETQFTRGVNTDTLSIPALQQPFAGVYRVTVTNSCGTATSREVLVTGNSPDCAACPACTADFDSDGGVTGADLAAFIASFEAGAACADVDRDGGLTGADVGAFFAAFEAGGC